MKRRESLNLAHVLEDVRPPPAPIPLPGGREKRIHTRFDKAFLVVIGSELYGDSFAIARNISAGGMLVEMAFPLPLGSVVTVHFRCVRPDADDDEIVARAEVKHHHYLNFTGSGEAASTRAIGLRVLEFVELGGSDGGDGDGGGRRARIDPHLVH